MSDDDRALILSDADRQTVYALITAQLGEQGVRVTPDEFTYFIRVAELRGLNPLFREVHLIKDKSGRINVQVGIDGFRKLAEASGDYAGQTEPVWGEPYEGPIEEWQGKPTYCRVGVLRHSWSAPVYGEAWLDEDGQVKAEWTDGPGGRRVAGPAKHATAQWAQRPRTMLKKVAESRAIRAAFPRSVAGLYTDDELPGHGPATPAAAPAATLPARVVSAGEAEPPTTESVATIEHPVPDVPDVPVAVEGEWKPAPDPDGTLATVREAPDGVRVVKSAAHPPRWDGTRPKLEIKVKVKGRNQTLMLFDDLAYAADAALLAEGESLMVQGGEVEERVWAEGKPTIKEVWGIDALLVHRDGEWRTLKDAELLSQPKVIDMPLVDSTAEPPLPVAEPTLEPAPELVEGWSGTLRVQLLAPIDAGQTKAGKPYASMRAAVVPGGEVVKMVLGDDPPGEIGAQLLGPDGKSWLYDTGDSLLAVGTMTRGWFILTYIGREAVG